MFDRAKLKEFQDLGIFRREDALPTMSPNNIAMPAGLLTYISPIVVENMVAWRSGDEALGGREKLGDWADNDVMFPYVERTGQTAPYSDFGQAPSAGFNLNFEKFGHYLFSAQVVVGNREAEQASRANVNAPALKMSSATEALNIELNRTYFWGYTKSSSVGSWLVYGLLNNPALANYESASKTFEASSYQEILAFFAGAIAKLTTQTKNNINGDSKIRVVISANALAQLRGKYTDLGKSVLETLKDAYPKMYFVSSYECVKANANQDVIYFIGETENGIGGTNKTTMGTFTELGRLSNVVTGENYFQQSMSCGTSGAIILKPSFVLRYTNI